MNSKNIIWMDMLMTSIDITESLPDKIKIGDEDVSKETFKKILNYFIIETVKRGEDGTK